MCRCTNLLLHVQVIFCSPPQVANCCVTAAVLIANMLTDAADLVLEISQGNYSGSANKNILL